MVREPCNHSSQEGHLAAVRNGQDAPGAVGVITVLLIRHGRCDPVGRSIAGRSPGVHLDSAGRRQAGALAQAIAELPVVSVYSSPLERARETAAPLAEQLGLTVEIASGLDDEAFRTFPDHHHYSTEDLSHLVDWAHQRGAGALVTTLKDLVKIDDAAAPGIPVYAIGISIRFDGGAAVMERGLRRIVEQIGRAD